MGEIEQMREDFPLAVKAAGWSLEDQAEIGNAIKVAIDTGDQVVIALWAQWIGDLANQWRTYCARVRQAEQNMKAVMAEKRLRAA